MPANEKQARRTPMTKPQVAEYINVSIRHITRLCQERRIPYFLLGGSSARFDPDEIDEWLLAQPRREAIVAPAPGVHVITRPLKVKTVTVGPKAKTEVTKRDGAK
ncbi:MAG TPA: helix-turn-helix domain-containing protein [Acidimicrobiales bacterium]